MNSPRERELLKALQYLKEGKVILYPSDTIWGMGGDATIDTVGEKVIEIKERAPEKGIIVLVDSLKMLSSYVSNVPKEAIEIIEQSEKPTTIIYPKAVGISAINKAPDGSIGIRVVKEGYIKKLISAFGKPISSSSANISSEPSPGSFDQVSSKLKERVDFIVDFSLESIGTKSGSSSIVKLIADGDLEWIRE